MSSRKKLILISLIFGGAITILLFVVLIPLRGRAEENSKEYALVKKDLEMIKSRHKELEKARQDYREVEKGLDSIKEAFVDEEAPLPLLEFLENSASEFGLSISISPYNLKEPEEESFWESIGLQVSLIGTFPEFFAFLDKIENSSYLIEVQSLGVSKVSEEDLKRRGSQNLSAGEARGDIIIKVLTK